MLRKMRRLMVLLWRGSGSVKGGELVQQGSLSASEIALNAQTLTQESRSATNGGNITLTTSITATEEQHNRRTISRRQRRK